MNFVIQLGFAAGVAAIGWATKKRIDNLSLKWENRVACYNYIDKRACDIDDMLTLDNGQIVEMKLQFKNSDGCLDMGLTNVLPLVHITLILRTDKNEVWSIEKNPTAIHVQKSDKEKNVMDKLNGECRTTSLKVENVRELILFEMWGFNETMRMNVSKKRVPVNDVLTFLVKKEVSIPFSLTENCLVILKRVVYFIFHGIPNIVTFYDYSSNDFRTVEERIRNTKLNVYISEIKWLYKDLQFKTCVGFLIKTNDGRFTSFEQDFDERRIQTSKHESVLLHRLYGNHRAVSLQRVNNDYSALLSRAEIPKSLSDERNRNIPISEIVHLFNDRRTIENGYRGFIEDTLRLLYDSSRPTLNSLRLYDNSAMMDVDLITTILTTGDTVLISDVSIWYKVPNEKEEVSLSRDDSSVLLIKTSDNSHWSLERVQEFTHLQRSNTEKLLVERLGGSLRENPLNRFQLAEIKIDFNKVKMKCF